MGRQPLVDTIDRSSVQANLVVLGAIAGAQPRLPDWLNPWWSETREIQSPMDAEAARTAIANAGGFLKGSLGKVVLSRSLTVFRESWWHLRRPWVVAQIRTRPAGAGSVVVLRLARTWFHSAFITFFIVFALGGPLVFLAAAAATGHLAATAWWIYPAWEAQDAAIYAACMALNSAAVGRDRAWLVKRITELVGGLSVS